MTASDSLPAPVRPDPPPPCPWRLLLVVMLLDAALVLPVLGSRTLWHIDEGRFAMIGRGMAESGDWIVPRVGGTVYACYPPLAPWTIAASGSVFGWSEWSVRLPSALAGVLLVGLAGVLAWRLTASRLAAAGAAIALATTGHFLAQQVMCRADVLLALFALSAVLLFDRVARDGRTPGRLVAFYACLALGVLTKGPLGVVLPGLVIVPWIAIRRRWDWIRAMQPWWGLPAVLLAVAPWYIALARAGGGEALGENLLVENVEAFISGHSHPQPVYFYAGRLALRALPWILALAVLPALRRARAEASFALAGTLATLAFLSVSTSKRLNYLTYVYPMLAVAEGIAAARLLEDPRTRRAASWILAGCAAVAAAGIASLFWPGLWTAELVRTSRGGLAAGGAALAGMLLVVAALARRGRPAAALGTLGAALAALFAFQQVVLEPRSDDEGRRGAAFCRRAGDLVPPGETLGAVGSEIKAFYYFYVPRPMVHIPTRAAYLAGPWRYGLSHAPERPDGAVVLAEYAEGDNPVMYLWKKP